MPAFNEVLGLPSVLEKINASIAPRFERLEIVIQDDASTDGTGPLLDRLVAEDPKIRVSHSAANAGHGQTLYDALRLAQGEWIFITDSDGQLDLSEFWLLWEHHQVADLVMGRRVRRQDPWHRRALSRLLWLSSSLMTLHSVKDANVPFKLLRADLWAKLLPYVPARPVFPSIMITLGAMLGGCRIVQVPIHHYPREHGTTTIQGKRLAMMCLKGLRELLGFRLRAPRNLCRG